MEPSTRSVVAGLLLCCLVLTAGCSGPDIGPSATGINVVNQDDVGHAVVVEIGELSDDPNPAYAAGRTLEAESGAELEPFDGTGEYEVSVTVDGESTVVTHTFNGEEPAALSIDIDDSGAVTVGSVDGDRTP